MASYYKTTIVYSVLHEEPLDDDMSIEDVAHECNNGALCGDIKSWDTKTVTGKEMADLLHAARSHPGFFELDDDGNEVED
jgi:hypothetical protein